MFIVATFIVVAVILVAVFIVMPIAVSVVDVVYVSSSLIPVVRVNAASSILGMKENIHGPKESVHCNSSLVRTALDPYDTTPLACVWTLGTSCGNYTSSMLPTWACNGRWLLGDALRVAVLPCTGTCSVIFLRRLDGFGPIATLVASSCCSRCMGVT